MRGGDGEAAQVRQVVAAREYAELEEEPRLVRGRLGAGLGVGVGLGGDPDPNPDPNPNLTLTLTSHSAHGEKSSGPSVPPPPLARACAIRSRVMS